MIYNQKKKTYLHDGRDIRATNPIFTLKKSNNPQKRVVAG
jgi:hypothetical protein